MSLAGKFLIKELQSVWLGGESITAASAGTIASIKVLIRDTDSNILLAIGSDVPADTTAGYIKGCLFINSDVVSGTSGLYDNVGTATSCIFNAIRVTEASDITLVEGNIVIGASGGKGTDLDGSTDKQVLIGNGTTMVSVGISGDVTMANTGVITIANNAISFEHLESGILSSHVIKYSGEITWSGSGVSLATTVTGALETDFVTATIQTAPSESGYLVSCAVTNNTITTTLSTANTTNDAVITYQVTRAVS